MKNLTKASLISVSLAILITSCNSGVNNISLNPAEGINQIQEQQEFSTFASESSRQIVIEQDANRDDVLTQSEASLTSTEMAQVDKNADGVISKSEISDNLQTDFNDALKVSTGIENSPQTDTRSSDSPIYTGALPNKLPPSTFKNNKVQLYIDREEILPMMLDSIKNAKKSIQMDVYLLGGTIGLQVANELIKKRNEGIDVKLTMDPNLGFAGPTQQEIYQVVNLLQKAKLDFKLYPLHLMPKVTEGFLKNKFQIDHDKLYVIDGTTLIIGGFNLFDLGITNRDLMMKIEGPSAQEASELMYYEWTLGDKYVAPKPPKDVYVVKAAGDEPSDAMVKIVKTAPFESSTKTSLIEMIDNAKQSVYLAVLEYSDLDVTRALIRAFQRGVDVRVLMDRKDTNDKYAGGVPVPTYFPNILPARELVKNHVPTRWYNARFEGQELHMKMVVVDGSKMIAGSTNFTRQAFTTFRETSAYVDGGTAPQKMVRTFMEDWINHSTAIKKITLKEKIKAKIVEFMDNKYYAWW